MNAHALEEGKTLPSYKRFAYRCLKKWEPLSLIAIALLLLVLHLVVISNPGDMILDEAHYVPEANRIVDSEPLERLEHPPLAKLIIAAGITLFGDDAFGWRIFSVLFGVASVILFYFICRKLTRDRFVPLIATTIIAFENMNFVLSSVAMLDVFGFAFMLASFLLFLHCRPISSGIALALGALAKNTAAFGGIAIVAYWLITRRKQRREILQFGFVAPFAFMALMPLFDWLAMGELCYPWDRLDFMREQMSSLTFSNVDDSRLHQPWEWIYLPLKMSFWYHPSYTAAVSWNLWGLIIPALAYAGYMGICRKNRLCLFALLWFASTWATWIAIYFITDRMMFVFYLYPSIGAICLIVGFGIRSLLRYAGNRRRRKARWAVRIPVMAWGISHIILFVLMGPLA